MIKGFTFIGFLSLFYYSVGIVFYNVLQVNETFKHKRYFYEENHIKRYPIFYKKKLF